MKRHYLSDKTRKRSGTEFLSTTKCIHTHPVSMSRFFWYSSSMNFHIWLVQTERRIFFIQLYFCCHGLQSKGRQRYMCFPHHNLHQTVSAILSGADFTLPPLNTPYLYIKMVKHWALTKINSVTVGTECPRPRMSNICSSPRYATGGWIMQCPIVRVSQEGNIGKREVEPHSPHW